MRIHSEADFVPFPRQEADGVTSGGRGRQSLSGTPLAHMTNGNPVGRFRCACSERRNRLRYGAENGSRTRGLDPGEVALCQTELFPQIAERFHAPQNHIPELLMSICRYFYRPPIQNGSAS